MFRLSEHFDTLPDETKALIIDVGANEAYRLIIQYVLKHYEEAILNLEPAFDDVDSSKFEKQFLDLKRYRDCLQDHLLFLEKENEWIAKIYGKQEKSDDQN